MRYTYEDLLNDPSVLERIRSEARRERAKAVDRLIMKPIKDFFASHAARPHLARQG
jgi:hypothetical protein